VEVARFFIEWLSIIGLARWFARLASGQEPWTLAAGIGVAAALLSYPLYLVAAVKFDKIRLTHLLAIAFLFPFWLSIMAVYIGNLGAWISPEPVNRWRKG
jgi:hypothetical protein